MLLPSQDSISEEERFLRGREQKGNQNSHSQYRLGRTLRCGMFQRSLSLARMLHSCIKALDTHSQRAGRSLFHSNVKCSYPFIFIFQRACDRAHLANVNGFIVFWVVSHPLLRKQGQGLFPTNSLGDRGTKQGLHVAILMQGPVPTQKGCEKKLESAWGSFLLGQGCLPCPIKIRVWRNILRPLNILGDLFG